MVQAVRIGVPEANCGGSAKLDDKKKIKEMTSDEVRHPLLELESQENSSFAFSNQTRLWTNIGQRQAVKCQRQSSCRN